MNRAERATQIWAVLAWCARHRQNISYTELAQVAGVVAPGLGQLLEPIQSYCIINNLPPLTVLVVQQGSGMPGSGFSEASATAGELASAQARVFSFDWLARGNPGVDQLEAAVQRLPSNANKD